MGQATNDRKVDFLLVHRELEKAITHLKEAREVLWTSEYWSATSECHDIGRLIKDATQLSKDFYK